MLTLDWIHDHLAIDRHALDDELAIHAQVLYEIGREVAALSVQVKEAKRLVEEVETREITRLRDETPKLGIANAERAAHSSPQYVQQWGYLLRTTERFDQWTEARAAWVAKGYSLKDLGALYASEYFTIESTRKSRDMTDVRAEMRARVGDQTLPARRPRRD